jgi:hypothetical protein
MLHIVILKRFILTYVFWRCFTQAETCKDSNINYSMYVALDVTFIKIIIIRV